MRGVGDTGQRGGCGPAGARGGWAEREEELAGSGRVGKKGRGVNWARGMLLCQEQGKAGLGYWVGLPPVFLGLTGSCRVGLVPVLGWVLGLVGFGVLVSFLFLTQLKSKELKLI